MKWEPTPKPIPDDPAMQAALQEQRYKVIVISGPDDIKTLR